MSSNQTNSSSSSKICTDSGYKIVQINMSDSTENLYAVVTPVKIK
ncbi:hypothetical protein [Bacillus sp. AK128]